MSRPTALAAIRAAARHTWGRIRKHPGCRHPDGCDQDPGDHVACEQHRDLPESTQRFMRRRRRIHTSTEEQP